VTGLEPIKTNFCYYDKEFLPQFGDYLAKAGQVRFLRNILAFLDDTDSVVSKYVLGSKASTLCDLAGRSATIMNAKAREKGAVLLVAIFVVALLSAVVMGISQITTEQIQLMRNQLYASEALAIAEAGINDAFAQLRTDNEWSAGFADKSFAGGSYSVAVSGTLPSLTIESTGTSSHSFVAKMEVDITVGTTSPYIIRIDNLTINEGD
jgi:hypothetical protein